MNKINIKEINLSALQKLNSQGTLSIIYTDGNLCYKFLNGYYQNEKENLYRKFLEMEGIKIDNVLLPLGLIIENNQLVGYIMAYFQNSISLADKFSKRCFNCNELLVYVEKASRILRDIHNNGIICQDLSFRNILVDDKGNVAFCDMDSCAYKEYQTPFYSGLLLDFLVKYRKAKVYTHKDNDKLSIILSFYLTIYGDELQRITKKQYHKLSDNINTLENLRETANLLVDKKQIIRDMPYLDEVIDLSDNYEINKKKILNFKDRGLNLIKNNF